jgi:hypothetical protein
MALLLGKGALLQSRLLASRDDLRVLRRVLWSCVLRASPRRAWFTLSILGETALRRPTALRDAVTLALMHKHLYEYMRDTSKRLDALIRELRRPGPAAV